MYLLQGNPHGPPLLFIRRISRFFSKRLTSFQTVTLTLLYLYLARNFAKVFNLESPEPLANLYSRSYFRATWVMTALDAGFWTAMRIKTGWLRDLCSVVFSLYYLVAAEKADEKVRRVRATITVDHLRVSWNKSQTPYLKALTTLLDPAPNRFGPRHIRISRPKESVYITSVDAWLYFEGTREELKHCTKMILNFPGGGFVAMSPRDYDDMLLAWARKCPGIPIVAVDYKRAPEFPYPYALNECYDVYHSIVYTKGKCVGLSGETLPRIALSGDSAGGNYAASVTLMILNSTSTSSTGHLMEEGWRGLPLPDGVVLVYPSLDLNISSWMNDDQMKLIRQRDMRKTNRNVVKRKSEYFERASGIERPPKSDEDDDEESDSEPVIMNGSFGSDGNVVGKAAAAITSSRPKPLSTRLAMTSRLSYFNDRLLTPEMMRAMVILYIGPHNRPDFATDFFLSPIVAPEDLLAQFPKTYFLTGERDPLVDDTVIFAGRIRQAKKAVWRHRRDLGLESGKPRPDEGVEVSLIPGISHGFLQMSALYPEAKRQISKCARWLNEILADRPYDDNSDDDGLQSAAGGASGGAAGGGWRKHERSFTGESMTSGEDDRPLEMSIVSNGNVRGSRGRGAPSGRRGRRLGSNASLGSEVDLVGRRMQGLAGGLTAGFEDEDDQ
ncbi:alpha/beta-hydrolase [Choiromyces venosus 120613-1]|uniref:Alpha/beta-hydrolase n=1 Tax=Choiromyces venosus 120613-1 TaxID=1336337 RepID=A0A3N4K4J5_9PEZI|nr:alpha/beta-hydrolase [Choiromyces venosus 120613-1]